MPNLSGKTAIVTGGVSGIGYAISVEFARVGAKVVIADIQEKLGKRKVQDLCEYGREAIFVRADVSEFADVKKMVREAIKFFGRIDILVNCAGIYRGGPITEMSEEEWDTVLKVNLKSCFLCTKLVAKEMIKHRTGGKIINISSVDGLVVESGSAAYCCSKAGIISLTKCAAVEMAKYRINVNAIAPGSVRTPANEPYLTKERIKALCRRIPFGEIAVPEDVAGGALYLASGSSRYVTGTTLVIDGGWTIDGTAR